MSTPAVVWNIEDPIIDRIEDQIKFYDTKSIKYQRYFKRIKVTEIIAAALIPFLAAVHLPDAYKAYQGPVIALLGVLITVLEGILQLNRYQHLWTSYRATCEALKHEKFTYIAKASVYAAAANEQAMYAMLAERTEAIMSQENTAWMSLQQKPAKAKGAGPPSQPVQ